MNPLTRRTCDTLLTLLMNITSYKMVGAWKRLAVFNPKHPNMITSWTRLLLVAIMVIDAIAALATGMSLVRFSRCLRPFMVILRLRRIRMVFVGYVKALPAMVSVFLLIFMVVGFRWASGWLPEINTREMKVIDEMENRMRGEDEHGVDHNTVFYASCYMFTRVVLRQHKNLCICKSLCL